MNIKEEFPSETVSDTAASPRVSQTMFSIHIYELYYCFHLLLFTSASQISAAPISCAT